MVKTMQAVINGQRITLTREEATGDWVASVTAPGLSSYSQAGHYFPVELTATDEAGNSTTVNDSDAALGQSLRLTVKERVAPVIVITAPAAGSYLDTSTPAVAFKITDNDSGVKLDSVVVKVDGVALDNVTHTAIADGYSFAANCGALTDGRHTVTVDAADNDGNAAVQASVSFTTDTVPPVLSVTAPTEGQWTNQAAVTVSGTTNDVTSSPVTLTVNGKAATVNADGSFVAQVQLTEGENAITVVAKDAAGKTSTVTRTVYLDTAAPTITEITLAPNPVDAGATYIIRVKATDD